MQPQKPGHDLRWFYVSIFANYSVYKYKPDKYLSVLLTSVPMAEYDHQNWRFQTEIKKYSPISVQTVDFGRK